MPCVNGGTSRRASRARPSRSARRSSSGSEAVGTFEDAKDAFFPFDKLVEEDTRARTAVAALCKKEMAAAKRAFVIVNNKAEGCAPLSLVRLAEELTPAR